MATVTDELRRMLTEAGVEWDYGITGTASTMFNANGVELTFIGMRDGVTCSTILTPAQAIDATVGRRTCHLEEVTSCGYPLECSECRAWYGVNVLRGELRFCPNCGRRVVNE